MLSIYISDLVFHKKYIYNKLNIYFNNLTITITFYPFNLKYSILKEIKHKILIFFI